MRILYHGSHIKLAVGDYLEPSGQRNSVYAIQDVGFALAYCGGRWSDKDLMQGSFRGIRMLVELNEEVFDRLFDDRVGYLYEVSSRGFKPVYSEDPDGEQVSKKRVRVLKRHEVCDIRSAIERTGWILVSFNELQEYIVRGVTETRRRLRV